MQREYPDRPIVGVGIVILGPEGVLLIRRGKPPRQGSWSLPGGAQKLGETLIEAARREAREETGLDIEVLGLIDVIDSLQRDEEDRLRYHYTLVDVFARAKSTDPPRAGADADDVRWFSAREIADLGLWSETERVIGLAREMADALADAAQGEGV